MQQQAPLIHIVIPNWNGKEMLKICLASLAGQTYRSFSVTVVDNGSTDGSVEWLKERHPAVAVLALPVNTGFCHAVNLGVRSGDQPYVFLLNNDTELDSECLAHLIAAGTNHEAFDFFAPKMLSFHEREILDGAGDGYLRGGAGYRLGTMETDSDVYSRPGSVFGACGGAAMYRKSLFETVGVFDEDYFAYLEDVDLNLRANRAGLSCYYVPQAKVYHVGCATTGSKFNPVTIRLSTRNSFYVLLKNYSVALLLRLLPVILIYQFCWILFVLKKKMVRPYLSGALEALWNAPSIRSKFYQGPASVISDQRFAACLRNAERRVVDSIIRRRESSGKKSRLLKLYCAMFL